jgi:hypothetical protein
MLLEATVIQTTSTQAQFASGMETVSLHLPVNQLGAFFPLLQKGVTVPATVGCTLRSLLCDQLAIPSEYVTNRITTLFLDNSPVDDLDRTIIHNGSRVTLSAAMPGLVGATMRRGGFYAALRQGISHVTEETAALDVDGTVRIKLFNLLLAELGPLLLARGIILENPELGEILNAIPGHAEITTSKTGATLLSVLFSE